MRRIFNGCCLLFCYSSLGVGFTETLSTALSDEPRAIRPEMALHNDQVGDQDDLCFWRHPSDPSQSLVIVSDKEANLVFAYDLAGRVKQTIAVDKPGNIDIRQNIVLGGKQMDLVAVNVREGQPSLQVFSVDPTSGFMTSKTQQAIATRPNYGGCLAYDPKQSRLWFFCTSKEQGVTQYELTLNESKFISGREVRHLELGKCEGAVADDDSLTLFVAAEDEGVWRFDMLPDAPARGNTARGNPSQGTKILAIGDSGIEADLEGITLGRLADSSPVFIVSSQGSDQFFTYDRNEPYAFRGAFRIEGATSTDGIDLIQTDSLEQFRGGIFGCHTDADGHRILLSPWSAILQTMP